MYHDNIVDDGDETGALSSCREEDSSSLDFVLQRLLSIKKIQPRYYSKFCPLHRQISPLLSRSMLPGRNQ